MPDFTITVWNDDTGWNEYGATGDDMDRALMESGALAELAGVDEGSITIEIEAA